MEIIRASNGLIGKNKMKGSRKKKIVLSELELESVPQASLLLVLSAFIWGRTSFQAHYKVRCCLVSHLEAHAQVFFNFSDSTSALSDKVQINWEP